MIRFVALVLAAMALSGQEAPVGNGAGVANPDRGQATAGHPVFLYEEALTADARAALVDAGAKPYFVIYQNNVDPDAQRTGRINVSALGRGVLASQGDTPAGWGVLDFEEPFLALIQEGPSHPRYASLVDTMVEAIRAMKRVFPNVKWTYYGVPGLLYYVDGRPWSEVPPEQRLAEERRQGAAWAPVMAECDWIAPCIYNVVGDKSGSASPPDGIRKSTRDWSEARTRVAVRFVKERGLEVPVIPFASPLFMPGGGARTYSPIPTSIFVEDTVEPARRAGASGLCLWMGAKYLIQAAARPSNDEERLMVGRWAVDAGLPREALEGDDGAIRVAGLLARSQVSAMRAASASWNAASGRPPAEQPGKTGH